MGTYITQHTYEKLLNGRGGKVSEREGGLRGGEGEGESVVVSAFRPICSK